ncbi:MAG: RNA polymerase sigma-70 factor [Odoribacteraceae bacterium]|jgi:RNA polymerase sigma-70 factor (ECF subfamily)|nr:RNA polymerase sigma-70 factor [Odoribacteraceae bacterium]
MDKSEGGQRERDEWTRDIREGKEEAFTDLFHLYHKGLISYAYRILRDAELASDTVQEAFCHLYEHRKKIAITLSIKSYLYKTVYNACLDAIKHRKVQHNYIDRELLDFYFSKIVQTPEAEMSLYNESVSEELRKTIARLPERCRTIFVLSKYEGLSNKQIAERLQISEKTVEAQMTRALSRLREDLEWLLCLIAMSM